MIAVVGTLSLLVVAIDPECQRIIDANTESLGLIHALHVEYSVVNAKSTDKSADVSWSREGKRERVRWATQALGTTDDGRPRGISDLLIDGDSYKWLRNWDPKNPQKITPLQQGTVQATVGPSMNENVGGLAPSAQLLFEVFDMPRRTLAELAKVSPQVACKREPRDGGGSLWKISLESPEHEQRIGKIYFDVYVDPSVGHMIRKVVRTMPNVPLPGGKSVSESAVQEVLEFADLGEGIFVPKRIRNSSAKDPRIAADLNVTVMEINKPLPADTFVLQWPKYAQVRYQPPVNGVFKVEVWGDGKPLRQISSIADVEALDRELRADPAIDREFGPDPALATAPPPASVLKLLFLVVGLLVFVLVAMIVVRRVRESRA